ncbi:unnamed protein product [Tetraodon nigroviridis]|uniref:(spotted green pufferfish) hypothetical protein n=1 Tax=Tetraodon nigroviridis TaxID=99883 RepID=Q4RTN5_TETNG|nr:unnamed protein product [Tetraodon nigroviridis]
MERRQRAQDDARAAVEEETAFKMEGKRKQVARSSVLESLCVWLLLETFPRAKDRRPYQGLPVPIWTLRNVTSVHVKSGRESAVVSLQATLGEKEKQRIGLLADVFQSKNKDLLVGLLQRLSGPEKPNQDKPVEHQALADVIVEEVIYEQEKQGSMIFVQWKKGLWCRANVIKVFQKGFTGAVNCCPADQLASVQAFCVDYGLTETVTIETETQAALGTEVTAESFVDAVNKRMRKGEQAEKVQLHSIAPLAIRCALKNLVPYSLVENMELALLSVQLQECYNAAAVTGADDLVVYCPVIGQAYVACADDQLWHRVQVIGHPGDGQVEIFYVDLGNKKIAPVTDLRRIKDEFFTLPIMAIRCCLEEIVPRDGKTWDKSCTERFISLAHQKVVTVVAVHSEADGEPLPIIMFESDLNGPQANMAQLLVKEGLACLKQGSMTDQAVSSGNEPVVWDSPLHLGLAACDVDSMNPKVTIEDKEELLTSEATLKLPAQLKELHEEVKDLSPVPVTLSCSNEMGQFVSMADFLVKRQFEQLTETVRQSIKTLPRPNSYECKSVQGCAVMGSDMLWYRGEVVEVLGEYVKFGGQWQWDAVALLREMLLNRTVDVDIKELPSDRRAALSVEVFIDGINLNAILSLHNHASVHHSVLVPKGLVDPVEPILGPFLDLDIPQKGAQFQARVRHLRTPNKLFLMPLDGTADLEVDGETLDDALRRVNAAIDKLPQIACFPQDYPCLAEYSDGFYYRAKIVKFASLEPACEPELTVLLYNLHGELVHLPLIRKGLAELAEQEGDESSFTQVYTQT